MQWFAEQIHPLFELVTLSPVGDYVSMGCAAPAKPLSLTHNHPSEIMAKSKHKVLYVQLNRSGMAAHSHRTGGSKPCGLFKPGK
jgi:hypothetical protein